MEKYHYLRFDLVLLSHGLNRINCIGVLRDIVPHFGLKEALDFVNQDLPAVVLTDITQHAAKKARLKLLSVGAVAKIRGIGSTRKFEQGAKGERFQS